MNILIVGIGRCGTISLSNGLSNQNYHLIPEPFSMDTTNSFVSEKKFQFGWWNRNKETELNFFLNKERNTLVKTLVGQTPKHYHGFKNWQSFISEFVKNFDKVLWMDRKNLDEHFLSIVNLTYKVNTNLNDVVGPWYKRWYSSDIPPKVIDEFEKGGLKEKLIHDKKILHETIKNLKGDIIWYEELYGEDRNKSLEIINSWGIDNIDSEKLNDYLHPSNRLKQTTKRQMI